MAEKGKDEEIYRFKAPVETILLDEIARGIQETNPFLDLVENKALAVTTTESRYDIEHTDFKLVLAFAWGANVVIDFKPTNEDSLMVPTGYAFKLTRKKRKIKSIFVKAQSGSGVLYLAFFE
jgi:hypothetical protein